MESDDHSTTKMEPDDASTINMAPDERDLVDRLAPEILCNVIGYLDFEDCMNIRLLSRAWSRFMESHESYIMKRVAQEQLKVAPPCQSPNQVHATWTDICLCKKQSDRNRQRSRFRRSYMSKIGDDESDVWRLKVDEDRRLLFTVCQSVEHAGFEASLRVKHLDTGQDLQEIPLAAMYCHIEYDSGYLVLSEARKIKVYVVDVSKIPARSVWETNGDILRLHAEQVPDFRFSTLRLRGTQLCLTGTEEARFIDILTMQVIETATLPFTPATQAVQYIEFDEEYLFICINDHIGESNLYTWCRKSSKRAAGAPNSSLIPPSLGVPVRAHKLRLKSPYIYGDQDSVHNLQWVNERIVTEILLRAIAVHYGKHHLVVAEKDGTFHIIENYRTRLSKGDDFLQDCLTFDLHLDIGTEVNLLSIEDDMAVFLVSEEGTGHLTMFKVDLSQNPTSWNHSLGEPIFPVQAWRTGKVRVLEDDVEPGVGALQVTRNGIYHCAQQPGADNTRVARLLWTPHQLS